MPVKTAIAIGAHPDDIEFYMAGTLLLFRKAGYEIHYLNLAAGNCGSVEYSSTATRAIRNTEARAAAALLGAHFHPSLTNDMEILYNLELLRTLTAVIREVKPAVVLTHSPQDYMEDHTNTCRLVVSAAFCRGMPNFKSSPARATGNYETTIYHAMPHGLRDGLRRRVIPEGFVNTAPVHVTKREALAAHKSQQNWLDVSQQFNSYLLVMEDMSLEMGRISRRFKHAEGWRRHLHYGFCSEHANPLASALGKYYSANKAYARSLEKGF